MPTWPHLDQRVALCTYEGAEVACLGVVLDIYLGLGPPILIVAARDLERIVAFYPDAWGRWAAVDGTWFAFPEVPHGH